MVRVEYALTSDRTMKALTGLTRPEFRALVPAFGQALYDQALQRDPPRQRRPGGGGPAMLKTAAAKLFFDTVHCPSPLVATPPSFSRDRIQRAAVLS